MAKGKKPDPGNLIDLAAELGIPSEVAAEAIETAQKTGDPAGYLRQFAADAEELRQQDMPAIGGMQPADVTPDIRNVDLSTSIPEIPLATMAGGRTIDESWPRRVGSLQIAFGNHEQHLQDALCRLYHGLQDSNARLRGRLPEDPPRLIVSHNDAVKWLLEQISLAE